MTSSVIFQSQRRASILIGTALILAAAFTVAVPHGSWAGDPAAAPRLMVKPQPPQPGKEVFKRSKPHVNVGSGPSRPQGPGSLKGDVPELADWYCGEGAGPGGHAVCTDELIASCNGTYKKPGTNGPQQTWGMCHEKS